MEIKKEVQKMKMKKAAAAVMAAVMSLSMATAVSAEQAPPQAEAGMEEIQPYFTIIQRIGSGLSLGSTTASILVEGYGQSGCASIHIYYAMQYKEGGSWHTWYSNSRTFYPNGSYTDSGIAYPKGKEAWRLEVVAKATSTTGRTETATDYKYV